MLSALYVLILFQRTMTGPVSKGVEGFRDLRGRELAAIAPLVVVLLVLGFVPQLALNVINPAIERTLVQVHSVDPPPIVSPAAAAAARVRAALADRTTTSPQGAKP